MFKMTMKKREGMLTPLHESVNEQGCKDVLSSNA